MEDDLSTLLVFRILKTQLKAQSVCVGAAQKVRFVSLTLLCIRTRLNEAVDGVGASCEPATSALNQVLKASIA